jgi:TolA-binding protein
MLRRSTRERLLLLAALAGSSAVLPPVSRAQDAQKLEQELRELEAESQQLAAEPLRGAPARSATYVEERLTDGELFYRLQDYVRASIILTDIVDNYPQHPAMPDALFLLGESLYSAGDYLGARTRLRQLIARADEPAFRPYASRSLGRLIEIAIHTRDFDGVESYFERLSRLPPQEIEAATAYYRAKYLYNRAVSSEDVTRGGTDLKTASIDTAGLRSARQAFEAVAETSPYFPQARYFIGVILTLERQFPQAIEAFRRVLRAQVTTPEQGQVVELAQLALGRLYYETDQLDQAAEMYQSVPRTSQWFDVALYEIAWVYIRMGDSTRAERALEVLSIAAPDSRYIADGSILRGNLLLRNGQLDDASGVFNKASQNYGPVRDKLDRIAAEHSDMQDYFRGLVRENIAVFDVNTILPAEAVPFASEEADMERALNVLSDLAQARDLVRDTTELMRRLELALDSTNRVNLFGDLRKQKQRTTVLLNRGASLRKGLISYAEQKSPNPSGELATVRAERKQLEDALGKMPEEDSAFADRDADLLGGFQDLSRQLSKYEVELLGMDARIVATERFLLDTQDARANPEGVAAMQGELSGQKGAIADYRKQIDEFKLQLESGRLQVGIGDPRYVHDDEIRRRYGELVDRERQLLASAGQADPRIDTMFSRVNSIDIAANARDAEIERVVEQRTSELKQSVDAESRNVEGYRQQLGTLETEAEDVVGGVTFANFSLVRARFYDLVLRADVGTIDVSWAEREEHRTRVEMLTRSRATEIRALDDEFQEIMDEPKGDEQ